MKPVTPTKAPSGRRSLADSPRGVGAGFAEEARGTFLRRGLAGVSGGSGLDGSLLREAMNNPDATADDINSLWEQMADLNLGSANLKTLSASTPKADLRFKPPTPAPPATKRS